jgi:hypothetical protein
MEFLVKLRGGPYDGQVFTLSALLGGPEMLPGIDGYEWTTERVTGKDGQKSAQVWQYRGTKVN